MPITLLSGPAGGSPFVTAWQSYTVSYTQLAAAALTNSITLVSLPARTLIHAVVIKHSAAFTGGAIASYQVSVGISGATAKFASLFSVFQAPGNTVAQVSSGPDLENFGAATNILLSAVSTGANLNAATAGSVTVWLLTSVLP